MIIVNLDEIDQYRSQFTDNSTALRALDVLEDCEGNLEDAAINLALKVGQEPTESEGWLDGFAKRWRVQLCQAHLRPHILTGNLKDAVPVLVEITNLPVPLAIALLIYAQKTGLDDFCQPLTEKL
ncbi:MULTISPECIES: hypothetical protein [unclassified Leptolyngbya]|uniref:hypothetical protein n=1 Tax=unclassified Leptolyngbya TaxID=2650499 RepID=UPI0018EF9198|nr:MULTISPECIES: hypothetical protein [unclassified Leptolyngbya]